MGRVVEMSGILDNPLLRRELIEEREYQVRIAEEATKRNVLVILPTALGKTVIAILAAAHFLYSFRDRKVLVMAPTKPLVFQHWENFLKFLRIDQESVEVLTGKTNPAYRIEAWQRDSRLYLATPQVVANDLERGLSLEKFSLLVFDECHRARKNYAYTKVARAYMSQCPYPIILAMTASPGAEREKIEEICRSLFIEHIEIRMEDDPDVLPYISRIKMEYLPVVLPAEYESIKRALREMLDERLRALVEMGVVKKPPKYVFRSDLLEAGEKIRGAILSGGGGALYHAAVLQSTALSLYHALELLESQGLYTLRRFVERLTESRKRGHRQLVAELRQRGVLDKLMRLDVDHPKLDAVERVVTEQLGMNPASRIIIFTQYRDTVSKIVERLRLLGIDSERFIGQARREGGGMSQEEQKRVLQDFREGRTRVLVATSIGEEGLDIPSVELVVFYEPVPSEIRFIQRKGRTGRRRFGRVVVLAAEKSIDTAYFWSTKRKVDRMKKIVGQLNRQLQPILRKGSQPEPAPMEVREVREVPEPAEDAERERVKKFEREVSQVSKRILIGVLRRGADGVPVEELVHELVEEGFSKQAIIEGAGRLEGAGLIRRSGEVLLPVKVEDGGKRHVFEVEKILPGRAILIVDGKWRSILTPECFNGPRELIRKGRRFVAVADLYQEDGKLHARIHSVEQVME
jgi:Fanconi anemia group M protein